MGTKTISARDDKEVENVEFVSFRQLTKVACPIVPVIEIDDEEEEEAKTEVGIAPTSSKSWSLDMT